MTGEVAVFSTGGRAARLERSLPQPGNREPAPGELALVQSFINSHHDLEFEWGADLFATPASLADWLVRRHLIAARHAPLTRGDARRAIAAREGLRALARANNQPGRGEVAGAVASLNDAARGAAVELRFAEDGPHFVAGARPGLDRALGAVLAIVAASMIEGRWSRLKVCPGERCGWAFYDHSRNLSGRWCSMAVCGGRTKARAHYRRSQGGGP
jgi:predicted RNA-binding Zn ribbon-like protein